MDGSQSICVDSGAHLTEVLETMVVLLVETRNAYGVVALGGPKFFQVMALDDGGLRLESSDSDKVLAADLGFDELVDEYDHIAAAHIPADQTAKEKQAAETLTRLAIEIHEVKFPANLDFHLDVNELATHP